MSDIMTDKTKNKKPKEIRLTIRLSEDEAKMIPAIQKALSDDVRGEVNQTRAVVSALRIATKQLNVTPKS